ncbi:hypothetical protein Moror_14515 [Moniliophthora roreri MCA 2997]|uniref:Acetoacetate decarboxylase n=1 Tax=Moniliophthora roreri (strain MCA 2997) TaxID=1381753 RepID=V2YNQ1_MONRO|nr:hypothetical protein Moror_14515 [Moniliophthora roreri MCA 2997]KAI3604187.1 hypothetical protein WG66_010151 [Moniliophthora roreri]
MVAVSESGIQIAPAPWKLRGRTWSFTLSPIPKNSSFPAGWAASWQAEALADQEFVGGPGLIMVVQYDDSPVGPYDELVYVPGRFKHKDGTEALRITRVYVSTRESTENGRRNWNIPKEVAKFKYTKDPSSPDTWSLSVYPIGSPDDKPFFAATIRPIPIITYYLRVTCGLSLLPKSMLGLMQPPLPKGLLPEEIASGVHILEEPEYKGKGKYAKLSPTAFGQLFFAKLTPEIDGTVGDGVSFPAVKPWRMATCMENFELGFPVTEWVEL